MSRLPHVVWDMGGILYHYFAELMVDLGRRRGWPLDRVPLGPTGDLSDPDYRRLVAGELIEPEYVRLVVDRLRAVGIDFDPSTDLDWEGWSRPEVFELIEDIASSGHRQAVLTNDASRWLGEGWWETWEHAAAFDAMVDVETIGVRKPAAAPYWRWRRHSGCPRASACSSTTCR